MSIDNIRGYDTARTQLQAAELSKSNGADRKSAPKAAPAAPSAADGVSFSDEARSLAAARNAVISAPDVREDKVASIKQSVEDGTYKVSPDLLARKMLSDIANG
jgi:negative regulator of flagellin synthesis FlgM